MLRRVAVRKMKERRNRRDWLAEQHDELVDPSLGRDSQTEAFSAKVSADDPRYKQMVAEPTMQAVDSMPVDYRAAVHDYGYVDVYRSWKRRWSVERVRDCAERMGGVFRL